MSTPDLSALLAQSADAGPESRYLDAARDSILEWGWSRSTLTDIARRAGVARMTIYRKWPDMNALLADLLVREWSQLFIDAKIDRGDLARGLTRTIAALRTNDLFVRIIDGDPELLIPYLFQRLGRNQRGALGVLTHRIEAGQRAGEFRAGDPQVMAQTLLLAAYGFVLSARTLDVSVRKLDAETRLLIERFLAP